MTYSKSKALSINSNAFINRLKQVGKPHTRQVNTAAVRKPNGDVADSWQDNQRRADQYLHRAAENDWWYSLQQTVDTEWF